MKSCELDFSKLERIGDTMKKLIKIGEFEVTGNKIIVTDPSYKLGDIGSYIINTAKIGTWVAFITKNSKGITDHLMAIHESIAIHQNFSYAKVSDFPFRTVWRDLVVDSGKMAICNLADYYNLAALERDKIKEEYDKYIRASRQPNNAEIVGEYKAIKPYYSRDFSIWRAYAVASQSGIGNGIYKLRVASPGRGMRDEIYAIDIVFL